MLNYFELAKQSAERFRDQVTCVSSVRVALTVIGPDNVTRIPYGYCDWPRCEPHIYEPGVLTITSQDLDEHGEHPELKDYQPGTWTEATVTDATGLRYQLLPGSRTQERKTA